MAAIGISIRPGREPDTIATPRARRLAAMSACLARAWLSALAGVSRNGSERDSAMTTWASGTLHSLNISVVARGHLPREEGAVLIAANHVSWLDICLLCGAGAPLFVAKAEVRSWPIVGTIARRSGSLFHERGNIRDAWRVKREVIEALRAGCKVVVFPEGTTTDGTSIRPFYPAFFAAAIEAEAMVQPVAIRYLTPAGTPTDAAAFVGDQSLANSIGRILREQEIVAEITFGEPIATARRTRRELARQAANFISATLGIPYFDVAPDYAALVSDVESWSGTRLRRLRLARGIA